MTTVGMILEIVAASTELSILLKENAELTAAQTACNQEEKEALLSRNKLELVKISG